jgi:hypothetical protein
MNNHSRQTARTPQNNFGVWVRNATDKGEIKRNLFIKKSLIHFSRKSICYETFT